MKPSARPVLAALRRGYTAQAARATQHAADVGPKISKLPNGATVATLENLSPVSRVAVMYNAGSRFESRDNAGVTHSIRSCSNLSTTKATGFGLVRNLQQIGANTECITTREHMMYTLDCTRNHLDLGLEFLGHMSQRPAFKAWEVSDHRPAIDLDLAILDQDPATMVMEGLHQAAYRDGLGRSLFMPAHTVGSHTSDVMSAFVQAHYTPANMTIVGVGVDHEEFVYKLQHGFGFTREPSGTAVQPKAAQYHGGEVRVSNNSPFVHAAVVTQGVSLGSKDMLPVALLQCLLGTGPTIKYSSAPNTKIIQAAAQATPNPFAASTINLNYSDTGLFGFHVITQAADSGKVLKAIIGNFSTATKGSFSDQEVARAKAQLKAKVLYDLENSGQLAEDMGVQVSLTGEVLTPASVTQAIDSITAADIQAAAKKVINGKPSMAAVGNLSETPYIDQLL